MHFVKFGSSYSYSIVFINYGNIFNKDSLNIGELQLDKLFCFKF